MTWTIRLVLALILGSTADLNDIRSEPNLEHRAHRALMQAAESFGEAKAAYAAGDREKSGLDLKQMESSVEIARNALRETGKDPRRHVKPFKMAETETRDLLRRLSGLENSMSLEDRDIIKGPIEKVQEAHDEWLNGIISGRR